MNFAKISAFPNLHLKATLAAYDRSHMMPRFQSIVVTLIKILSQNTIRLSRKAVFINNIPRHCCICILQINHFPTLSRLLQPPTELLDRRHDPWLQVRHGSLGEVFVEWSSSDAVEIVVGCAEGRRDGPKGVRRFGGFVGAETLGVDGVIVFRVVDMDFVGIDAYYRAYYMLEAQYKISSWKKKLG
jgi:hypothetical protein